MQETYTRFSLRIRSRKGFLSVEDLQNIPLLQESFNRPSLCRRSANDTFKNIVLQKTCKSSSLCINPSIAIQFVKKRKISSRCRRSPQELLSVECFYSQTICQKLSIRQVYPQNVCSGILSIRFLWRPFIQRRPLNGLPTLESIHIHIYAFSIHGESLEYHYLQNTF